MTAALAALLLIAIVVVGGDDDTKRFFLVLEKNDISLMSGQTPAPASRGKECFVGSSDNLKCLCGNNLTAAHENYRNKLNNTCDNASFKDDQSPFSFCNEALRDLGYSIQMINLSDNSIDMVNGSFSVLTLNETINNLETSIAVFDKVLKRTIVGILIETEGHRCACLVSLLQAM